MSLHSITSSISQTGLLPQVNFGGSPKKKSNAADTAGSDASSIGQIPVGTGQNLLANALQALQHAVGAQAGAPAATATGMSGTSGASAVSAATSAQASVSGATASSSAGATSPLATDLQGFLHSLFSALRQDSTSVASSATTASTAANGVSGTTNSGASQYQGSLVSSLQTLIQQLSGGGTGTQATANLSNSFSSLVHGLSASTAAAGTGAAVGGASATAAGGGGATASTSQLTSFLDGLLQKIQSNGSQAPSLLGAHVNANV